MAPRPGRLERITNLVLALLETQRPLPLSEIGSVVEGYPTKAVALRQAFERDKRTLRQSGITVAVERIGGADQFGYRIDRDTYYLPELELSEDEREALGFALAAVRLEGGLGNEVAHKLGAVVPAGLPPVALLPAVPHLGPLQEAVRTRAKATFSYNGERRTVLGYGLVFKAGRWYFVGADEARSAGLRTFRVDRVESAPELGEKGAYEPPAGFSAREELRFSKRGTARREGADKDPEPLEVLVAIDRREVFSALESFGEDRVRERREDGSVVIGIDVGDEEAFVSYVLGLGDAAEVLGPPALRDLVVRRLRGYVGEASR